jgi:hypothetical protein
MMVEMWVSPRWKARLLNDACRRGEWEAFGYSPKLGKRVRIEAPWRPELRFDDLGNMQDGDECFTNVLFYKVD